MRALPLLAALIHAPPLWAETDFTALTAAERAAFHAEIRAVLLANPDLSDPPAAPSPYADNVAADLALIAAHRAQLFVDGAQIALFTAPDCPDCARARQDLTQLGVVFQELDITSELAGTLGLGTAPSYVLPDMFVQGHMPAIVLKRYLAP